MREGSLEISDVPGFDGGQKWCRARPVLAWSSRDGYLTTVGLGAVDGNIDGLPNPEM